LEVADALASHFDAEAESLAAAMFDRLFGVLQTKGLPVDASLARRESKAVLSKLAGVTSARNAEIRATLNDLEEGTDGWETAYVTAAMMLG
jgi:hypothetical protein